MRGENANRAEDIKRESAVLFVKIEEVKHLKNYASKKRIFVLYCIEQLQLTSPSSIKICAMFVSSLPI